MLTPVFHPNIAPHAICIGDHWSAGESLQSLVARIGEILTYQSYNTKSPLNGEAARWIDGNIDRLPLETVNMAIEESNSPDEPLPPPPPTEPLPVRRLAPPPPVATMVAPPPVQVTYDLTCPNCSGGMRLRQKPAAGRGFAVRIARRSWSAGVLTSVAVPSSQDLVASDLPDGDVLSPAMRGIIDGCCGLRGLWRCWPLFLMSARIASIFCAGVSEYCDAGELSFAQIFHMDCPGCGLTRSIVFLVHGEVRASWQMNRVGWIMLLAILGQVPYRIMCLRRGRRVLGTIFSRLFGRFLILMLVGNWGWG